MARLSTHVLDTAGGRPAAGVEVRFQGKTIKTGADGRAVLGEDLPPGIYELVFAVGAYFGTAQFLDEVVVRFRIAEGEERYHVPLLVSPYGYTTYRGS
ncbi:MAG TPA: hydroxyisourate hydrolase [Candidatus Acidoferrales bacterium]|nr:hydroxyisourate hydrolase [Candidatus Acidoferrales bacterium]